MVAYTTTYNLKKPTVADDEDVWGGYLNDSMDLIDDVLDGTTPVTGIDINSGTIDNVVVGGTTAVAGTFTVLTANTSLGVTGNITVSGTVDGRDVAADGTKLDGVESGATADQTKADIDALGIAATTASTLATARNIALSGDVSGSASFNGSANISITATVADDSHNHVISNVDGLQTALDGKLSTSGKAADSNLLDGIDSSQFLRSDTSDTMTGPLTIDTNTSGMLRLSATNGSPWAIDLQRDDATNSRVYNNNGCWDFEHTPKALGSTVWHAGNDGSGSGLDADLWDGNQFSNYLNQAVLTSSTPTFANINVAGWIAHSGDGDTYMNFGTNEISFYAGNSAEVTINTTGVRLGDTGNGYFQPVSGGYGSIQIDGGAHSSYEGYSIGGRAVFMHNNANSVGIYNDVNDEWMFRGDFNGTTQMYHNGSPKLDTLSNGVSINGNLYTDGSNAEDYDALSGTSPTCNVDNAGAFSLTMSGETTFTFSGADNNWSMGFILQLTGNGSTVIWPTSVDWAGGTAPDAPASGETDIYVFWTRDGGTTWYGVQSIDAAA